MITHNWHGVDPSLRLGQSPDDVLTLYRGFAPDQLSTERGMLSSDARADRHDAITRVVQAINENDIHYLAEQLRIHVHNGYAEQHGLTTPFVSVTPKRSTAESYSGGVGEKLATLAIRASRVIVADWWPNEFVVLGEITPEEVVRIEDGTPRPHDAMPYISEHLLTAIGHPYRGLYPINFGLSLDSQTLA